MAINVALEILQALIKEDIEPEAEISEDRKTYSMEWAFDDRKKLFIDVDAGSGTIQIVWKSRNTFHQFSVDVKEKD
jgi:hypothetical protein